ncbi:MAG: peptidoglycan endopeptidase [Sphingobium sp.]
MGDAIAAAALALVGVPFRLHGRCAQMGVDCVGLALLALRRAGLNVPEPPPYRLRAGDAPMLPRWMHEAGFVAVGGRCVGDLVAVRVGALQPHLMVDGGDVAVHAHAAIGRVVAMPMPGEWPELSRWRHMTSGG